MICSQDYAYSSNMTVAGPGASVIFSLSLITKIFPSHNPIRNDGETSIVGYDNWGKYDIHDQAYAYFSDHIYGFILKNYTTKF